MPKPEPQIPISTTLNKNPQTQMPIFCSNADDSRRSYEVSHYEPTSAPAAGNSSSLTQALTLLICVIPITMLMIR